MGLKMRSLELEGWENGQGTSRAKHFRKNHSDSSPLQSWSFLLLRTLMIMNPHENIIPPNYGDLIKPKIVLGAHLTPSIIGLSVGEGIPAMV